MACGAEKTSSPPSPLLRLLGYIPDTPFYRQYLTYGDAEAWYASWNISRADIREELEDPTRKLDPFWVDVLTAQTIPPENIGYGHFYNDPMRRFYAFDVLDLDRYVHAGLWPEWITVADFNFDQTQVTDAVIDLGYETKELESGGTLYKIMKDYAPGVGLPTVPGSSGDLNRIVLTDGQIIIARATVRVNNALQAHNDELTSLADNPDYIAVAKTLEDPALEDTGELVGVILMDGAQFAEGLLSNKPGGGSFFLKQPS